MYFGEHSGDKTLQEIEESHVSYLYYVKETEEDAKSSIIYSYKQTINGFAALLTPLEASKLSGELALFRMVMQLEACSLAGLTACLLAYWSSFCV